MKQSVAWDSRAFSLLRLGIAQVVPTSQGCITASPTGLQTSMTPVTVLWQEEALRLNGLILLRCIIWAIICCFHLSLCARVWSSLTKRVQNNWAEPMLFQEAAGEGNWTPVELCMGVLVGPPTTPHTPPHPPSSVVPAHAPLPCSAGRDFQAVFDGKAWGEPCPITLESRMERALLHPHHPPLPQPFFCG